jgi:multisubunit Na+/H+ antiporter MnhC subunit
MIGGLDFLFWPVVIGIAVLAVVLLVVWRIRAISKSGGWSSSSSA